MAIGAEIIDYGMGQFWVVEKYDTKKERIGDSTLRIG